MKFSGERFIPGLSGEIQLEHFSRYYFVIKQIDLSNKIVLDLASGEGYGSDLLAHYSKQVIGIDISSKTIEHAKSKYAKSNLSFEVGAAINIPLPDHTIDVFVSFETIEHHDKHFEMLHEIKRVLKPDGILVMSSPDKYYYSDKPNLKNKFHIKELYYDDYKHLIKSYFTRSMFYSQKIFAGSIIALDDNIQCYKKPLVVDIDGYSYDLTPVYNITIATDNNDFNPTYQIVLYKECDHILTNNDIQQAILFIQNSKAYKLGNFFIKPLRILNKFFLRNKIKHHNLKTILFLISLMMNISQ